jgi:putative peptide-modifying radical SAM enzyme
MNTPNPKIMPLHMEVDIDSLKRFISLDSHPIICFYGGDPLYKIPLMEKIMDEVMAEHYVIQTNGIMLHRVRSSYLKRIDTLLVSLDGRPETTDYYRGEGIHERVINNVRYALSSGFKGDLVARMTVSGHSDIYEDVRYLLNLQDPRFTHVHWQLDVLWDYPPAQRYDDFDRWVKNSYNPGITRLIDYWIREMEDGHVLGIAPFKGLMWSMITGENKYSLRCGSGEYAFAIGTDGRVLACPIAPEFSFNILGNIYNSKPIDLPRKVRISEPCTSCEYYKYCGGRCLFANKTMLWGREGFEKVCNIVKHLIDSLLKYRGRVLELVGEGVVRLEDIRYPPYPNSVEIIP